ncbi:uncharacterized protein LOC112127420 [Cimex lectularius]|uniref:RNase H type-1 domain-containing protein n=1 Tax=Cimex lectularius TaxID=79782 RepID=A0A8I6SM15_CIMLE|nr:uncharacterized protein LOC112127420 [Cimex lectularius]
MIRPLGVRLRSVGLNREFHLPASPINSVYNSPYVVCSDSGSALHALEHPYSDDPGVQEVLASLGSLQLQGKSVYFVWVPGHVNIKGNHLADEAAKEAAITGLQIRNVPKGDMTVVYKSKVKGQWEQVWINISENKLREIKNSVDAWPTSFRNSRREEVVLARLRIGHCRATKGHLMGREAPPICGMCNQIVTIKHILMSCSLYAAHRRLHSLPISIQEMLGDNNDSIRNLFDFLKLVNLLDKI